MIVFATDKHLEEILTIEVAAYEQAWSYVHFQKELTKENGSAWVFSEDGNVLGYLFGEEFEKQFFVNNITVKPEFSRRGIASKLMNHCIDIAENNQVNAILFPAKENGGIIQKFLHSLRFRSDEDEHSFFGKGPMSRIYKLEL